MRRAALLGLLFACMPYKPPPTVDYYRVEAPWKVCADSDPPYSTWTFEMGLRFYAVDGAACPDDIDMEATARHALERTGGEINDIWGTRIILVPTRIQCAGLETFGCTDVNETHADIFITDRPGAWTSVRHEIGHVVRFRRRGDGDASHRDCVFWAALEGRDCGVWK